MMIDPHTTEDAMVDNKPSLLDAPKSWVVKEIVSGKVICELSSVGAVDKLNTAKYVAVPLYEHLQSLNR